MERPSNEALWSLTLMNWREKEKRNVSFIHPHYKKWKIKTEQLFNSSLIGVKDVINDNLILFFCSAWRVRNGEEHFYDCN